MRPGLSSSGSGGFCALFFGHVHRGLDLPIWRRERATRGDFCGFCVGFVFFFGVDHLWHQFGNFFHQHQKLKDEKFIHEFKKHILKWPFFTRIFLFCVFFLTNLVVLKPSIKQQSFREKVAAFGIYISEANRFGPNLVHQLGPSFQL